MKDIVFEVARRHSYTMPSRETHIDIEIYYLSQGERLYFVENKTYHLTEGSVILINSNRIHKTSSTGKQHHERMLLEVRPEFLRDFSRLFPCVSFERLLMRTAVVCPPSSELNADIRYQFEKIQKLTSAQPYGYEEEVRCAVYTIFLAFRRQALLDTEDESVHSPKYQRIYEAVAYISQNMESITSLDELCDALYISKYYLCHSFKEVTGMSVIAFLNAIRLRRAKVLLLESNLSVSQIAQSVGFESAARLSSLFTRCEGMTPRQFRKQGAAAADKGAQRAEPPEIPTVPPELP